MRIDYSPTVSMILSDTRPLQDDEEDIQLSIGQIMSYFDDIVQPIENDIENGSNSHLSTFVCLSDNEINLLSDNNRCVALSDTRYIYRSRSNAIFMFIKCIDDHYRNIFKVRYCLYNNN